MARKDKGKRQIQQEVEKIEAMGQESEKGAVKWVKEVAKEVNTEEKIFEAEALTNLERKSRFTIKGYHEQLYDIVNQLVHRIIDLPKDYGLHAFHTRKGVGILVVTPDQRKFTKAFAPVHDPRYDLNACAYIVNAAQDFIDQRVEDSHKTPSGIHLVN